MKLKKLFDWRTITIPISHLIFAAIVIVLVIGIAGGVLWSSKYSEKKVRSNAESCLTKAKSLIKTARESKIPESELKSIEMLIKKTESYMRAGDYLDTCQTCEDAVQQLEYLLASFKPEAEGISGRYARVTEMHGQVEMLPPGSADWQPVTLNLILRSGTRIRTLDASSTTLKFDDGSTIQMKNNSLIMIRELTEDEQTLAKSSNIELGTSEIEAMIREPIVQGSSFLITMPNKSQALIETESNFSVQVDKKKKSVVKVFMGRVDILKEKQRITLSNREAVILDFGKKHRSNKIKPIPIPLPPRLIYPANVQLITITQPGKDPIYFRWTTIEKAHHYKLEIARDYYFFDIAATTETNKNRATITTLNPGNYFWRVQSITKSGLSSEPSAFNSFRVIQATDLDTQQKDLTPPQISIDRITLLGHIVDISGKTEPGATLYVNERKEEVHDDGTFRALVEFKKSGLQTLYLEAYDSSGNVASIKKEITIPEIKKLE